MLPTARQLVARLLPPRPEPVEAPRAALGTCTGCACTHVQPLEWRAVPGRRIWMALRCPDCEAVRSGTFREEVVHDFERELARGRAELRRALGRAVRENMYAELDLMQRAFELELVGPDDFASLGAR